jgi:hypothetical protein
MGSSVTRRVTLLSCEIRMSEVHIPELNQEFTLKIDGEPREVVMKFGLLRELARAFPDPNDPQQVFHSPDLFETALTILLVPRDAKGKPTVGIDDDWSIEELDMDSIEAIGLVKWGMEHLLGFFLQKFRQVTMLGETQVLEIETLLSSLPGLKDSLSKKASVGDTASNTLSSESFTGE